MPVLKPVRFRTGILLDDTAWKARRNRAIARPMALLYNFHSLRIILPVLTFHAYKHFVMADM
jgi:hypothetical protein